MPNLNVVLLMGNLTRDPELRFTPAGTAVCKFGLAMNRKWKKPDGTLQDEVCFVDVTAWKRSAELCSEYLKKGQPACVEGRLRLDRWEKDGQKHSKLEVVANRIHFVGGGRNGGSAAAHDDGEASARSNHPARETHAMAASRSGASILGSNPEPEETAEEEGAESPEGEEVGAIAGQEKDPPF